MKRFLPVILSGLMAFTFFACTKKDAAENAGAPAEMAPQTDTAPAAEEAPPADAEHGS